MNSFPVIAGKCDINSGGVWAKTKVLEANDVGVLNRGMGSSSIVWSRVVDEPVDDDAMSDLVSMTIISSEKQVKYLLSPVDMSYKNGNEAR